MRHVLIWSAVIVLAAGCGGGGGDTTTDGPGSQDGAPGNDGSSGDGPAADGSSSIDAPGGGDGVACGTMTCASPQVCCVTGGLSGQTRTCSAADQCQGTALACDGREDCGPDQDCCLMLAVQSGPLDGGLDLDGGLPGFDGGFDFDGGLPDFDGGLPDFDGGLPDFDGGLPDFDGGLPDFDGGLPDFDGGLPGGGGSSCQPQGTCQLRACNDVGDCNSGESCCDLFGQGQVCQQTCF